MTAKKPSPMRADACPEAPGERRGASDEVGHQAAPLPAPAGEMRLGEAVDATLDLVRRYPAAGVSVAALVGFFVGRLWRR
jgi:hypothetical protein